MQAAWAACTEAKTGQAHPLHPQMRRWNLRDHLLSDLLQDDVGVHHQVLLCVRRQLGGVSIAVWIQGRAAGDVIAQVVLSHHLRSMVVAMTDIHISECMIARCRTQPHPPSGFALVVSSSRTTCAAAYLTAAQSLTLAPAWFIKSSMFRVLSPAAAVLPSCRCRSETRTNVAQLATALHYSYQSVCKACRKLYAHKWQLHLQAATSKTWCYRPCLHGRPPCGVLVRALNYRVRSPSALRIRSQMLSHLLL